MKKIILILTTVLHLTFAHGQCTKLLDFAGASNGANPGGYLYSDGIFLYGMTVYGGFHDDGVIFKIKPDGTGYVKLLDFAGTSNGSHPNGSLISDGTFLYGMTQQGDTNNNGLIFKIKPDGTGYVKLLDFSGASNGTGPAGSLISDGTFLYGMTQKGGINDSGVIFKIKPDGTGYVKLLDFAGAANGAGPLGSLYSDGTFLYGVTQKGGINNNGVIFKIKPDGTSYVKLLDFAGTSNGSRPTCTLISDGTFLYGTTSYGGTNNDGVIFKIKPDGSGYVKLLDFLGANGSICYGALFSDGTFLYGMAGNGGSNFAGVAFKIMLDGTGFAKLLDFSSVTNGGYPSSSFISDGAFLYGMTGGGGTNQDGIIFKLALATAINENLSESMLTIYPNPFSTSTIIQTGYAFRNATLTINNCFGQIVSQIKNLSGYTIVFNRNNLASGLYFLQLTEDNKIFSTEKLVVTDK